jgi:hypothetical protein
MHLLKVVYLFAGIATCLPSPDAAPEAKDLGKRNQLVSTSNPPISIFQLSNTSLQEERDSCTGSSIYLIPASALPSPALTARETT